MRTVPHNAVRWRKSSRSTGEDTCVELAWDYRGYAGMVRDSKNPTGPVLNVDLAGMVAAIKVGDLCD